MTSLIAGSVTSSELWHRRFGHINYNDLRVMRDEAVEVEANIFDEDHNTYLSEKDDPEFVPQHVNSYDRPDGQTRRSERVKKPKSYEDYVTFQCQQSINLDEVPIDAADALSTPDADRWRRAMEEEMMSFSENETWELVDAPTSGTVVQCKWFSDTPISEYPKTSQYTTMSRFTIRKTTKGAISEDVIQEAVTLANEGSYSWELYGQFLRRTAGGEVAAAADSPPKITSAEEAAMVTDMTVNPKGAMKQLGENLQKKRFPDQKVNWSPKEDCEGLERPVCGR
ncbi:hypothetical protein NQ318_008348 [Aromia moschata]|uniref:GAG-pre-integrase domain-containing protein n=1 Tax=Aromia moschata TaxID=1265417 RepID=A0AAV8YJP6_9CUCU|nr:hypothetical protein NQ318_008348 [Aromia moschata]